MTIVHEKLYIFDNDEKMFADDFGMYHKSLEKVETKNCIMFVDRNEIRVALQLPIKEQK